MKRIFFILCCFCAFALYGQDTQDINKTDAQGRKQGAWKKYEKGKLVYEGQFKDNVPYGTFHYYHANGKPKSTTEFLQGVHKVKTIIYHENGHKASEGVFIDQKKDGVWNYYANNDRLISVEEYTMGKRSGTWKIFSKETGVLLEESNYVDNRLSGIYKTFYTDGSVSLEENYLNGVHNGRSTSYYPKGHISVTGDYRMGKRIGDWEFYDAGGKHRSTVNYNEKGVAKTYVYLYKGNYGQKINQDLIAYFLKTGDKSAAVLRDGKRISIDESLDDVSNWADFMVFTRISPSVIAASDAIVDYKDVEGTDDAITIKLNPSPDMEIYSEGVEAKMVKALFNKEKPKE
jgi:Uncharacterized protein conserved in bacteria